MNSREHSTLSIASAVLMLTGGLGLALLFVFALPTLGPRWLFYLFWVMGLTGAAVPFVRYLNRRFSGDHLAPATVLLRQSLWVGILGGILAWLQISRVLNPLIAFLVGAALAAMEWFLRLRERSRWVPEE